MTTTLDLLTVGKEATIVKVEGDSKLRRRLFDMGVTPGAKVVFRKKAPFGDPIEITIRGYELSLRLQEATNVIIRIDRCSR
ncbi:ferrous iron transport protein A [Acholeplasma sp. OttesenSCG-928-E16]|nr:ferrous iron transport protein A [Acholeplasma sp. OttesenSCG-928-E16]